MNKQKKSFFPKDKPKSWVIAVSSALMGLLLAVPVMLLGMYLEIDLVKAIGTIMFVLCWAVFAITSCVCAVGMLTGKYRNLKEKEWREQLW